MKMVFITGSLEPGRNGVGDYTRRLACEIIRMGHGVKIIALHDANVSNPSEVIQTDEDTDVDVLRLPVTMSLASRTLVAKKWVDEYDPEFLSLQYVSFAFDPRGLPLGLNHRLKYLGKGRKWNIMFHELWCGMNKNSPFKEKILGRLQKLNIKNLVRTLKPHSVFTNLDSYNGYLGKIDIPSSVVPIFGNISLNEWPGNEDWDDILQKTGLFEIISDSENWFVIGFFGTIYKNSGLSELIEKLNKYALFKGKKLAVLIVGHGRGLDFADKSVENIKIFRTGKIPSRELNKLLRIVHLGIMTTPADGLDKSGSAIAWIERSIPVVISEDDPSYLKVSMEKMGVFQIIDQKDIDVALNFFKVHYSNNRLEHSAQQYIKLFTN